MTKRRVPSKPRPQPKTTEPIKATPDQQAEARARADACAKEVAAVLTKHSCNIVPMLASEGVGQGPGMKLLLSATYGILPTVAE